MNDMFKNEKPFVIHFGEGKFWAATPLQNINPYEFARGYGPEPGEYYRVNNNDHRQDTKFYVS